MDNDFQKSKAEIVTGPSIRICPACGPTSIVFSGRVIAEVCDSCKRPAGEKWPGRSI